MSGKVCDHTSVGVIVRRDKSILLIERRKPPFGYAPPAGHVDDHGGFEAAAKQELSEEVGLTAVSMRLVLEKTVDNACRRVNGSWHHWQVYEVEAVGNIVRSDEETKQALWIEVSGLQSLAERTRQYQAAEISDSDWRQNPGLEPVWLEHLTQLAIIQR